MNVLSFLWSECSTAAVVIDGQIAAATSEERFSRIKNDERFPANAIREALDTAGVQPEEIDVIALPGYVWSPRYILSRRHSVRGMENRLREQKQYWFPIMYEKKEVDYYEVFHDFLDLDQYPGEWEKHIDEDRRLRGEAHNAYFQEFRRKTISKFLGTDPRIVRFIHHHRAHAYYVYHASPTGSEPTLVLTADAWGDDMNASVNIARPAYFERISQSDNFMLGRLYRHLTLLLGMKPDEHEYKVMGLAPYGNIKYYKPVLDVLRNTQYVNGLGFDFHQKPTDSYVYFREKFEGMRFDSIAAGLQHYTEEILTQWVRNAIHATGIHTVAFGGGLGMNVKAMMRIAQLPELERLFVPPTPSDESLAIGAAIAGVEDVCTEGGKPVPQFIPLNGAYLGPELKLADIRQTVEKARSNNRLVVRENVTDEEVVCRLEQGKILGRCVGRSEFGARALGNRSILGDPRTPETVALINKTIKNRDFWMPFAPSILSTHSDRYIVNPKELIASYMTLAFETNKIARVDLKASLHPADQTCRPQILEKGTNEAYSSLLEAFERKTGVGGVLNTSFNVHGEPIIQTALEALDILLRTELDMIQVNQWLIEKKATKDGA